MKQEDAMTFFHELLNEVVLDIRKKLTDEEKEQIIELIKIAIRSKK